MGKVTINIPDDRWFSSEWSIRPADKELCVVIHKYGNQTPGIYQYRKADWLHPKSDYFLDVSGKWRLDSFDCGDEWEPSFATMSLIDCWKPLGLPEEVNERLLIEIESWFEGE